MRNPISNQFSQADREFTNLQREIIDKIEDAYHEQKKSDKDRQTVFEEVLIQRIVKLHDLIKTQKAKIKAMSEEFMVFKRNMNLKKHETDNKIQSISDQVTEQQALKAEFIDHSRMVAS